ncbi:hypothetical protein OIV83_003150 [Microbotryomycetes sp. JL201]|nr:hypothetical protein OIV83_003150 [Microbotryomycetes sp. JL201]
MADRLIQRFIDEAYSFHAKYDPSHDFQHVRRVCLLALSIAQSLTTSANTPSVDLLVIQLASLAHDMLDKKYLPKVRDGSPLPTAKTHLARLYEGFENVVTVEQQDLIAQIVDNGTPNRVKRADGMVLAVDIERYGDRIAFKTPTSWTRSDSAIQHFHDKLFKLEAMMKTNRGRELARQRTEYMRGKSPLSYVSELYKHAVEDGTASTLTIKDVRARLESEFGWTCDKVQWKQQWKDVVEQEWLKCAAASSSSAKEASSALNELEPKKIGTARKTKYERVAERNTIMGAFLEDLTSGVPSGNDDDGDEDDEDSLSQAGSDISRTSSVSAKKSSKGKGKRTESQSTNKPSKKRARASAGEFKPETISDSDDERPSASTSKAKKKTKQEDNDVIDKDDEAISKKTKALKAKATSKERAPPKLKEGDAPRGTDEQEERVKKLKALVVATGVERAFTASTGAERRLTIEERLERLETLLADAKVFKRGSGKLPSLEACRKVGQQRALEKEMRELQGTPETSGLRDGKRRSDDGRKDVNRPQFGAFLKAFDGDSSESD